MKLSLLSFPTSPCPAQMPTTRPRRYLRSRFGTSDGATFQSTSLRAATAQHAVCSRAIERVFVHCDDIADLIWCRFSQKASLGTITALSGPPTRRARSSSMTYDIAQFQFLICLVRARLGRRMAFLPSLLIGSSKARHRSTTCASLSRPISSGRCLLTAMRLI